MVVSEDRKLKIIRTNRERRLSLHFWSCSYNLPFFLGSSGKLLEKLVILKALYLDRLFPFASLTFFAGNEEKWLLNSQLAIKDHNHIVEGLTLVSNYLLLINYLYLGISENTLKEVKTNIFRQFTEESTLLEHFKQSTVFSWCSIFVWFFENDLTLLKKAVLIGVFLLFEHVCSSFEVVILQKCFWILPSHRLYLHIKIINL